MRIKDFNDEPHFTERTTLISSQIQLNMFLTTYEKRKIRRRNKIIRKAMVISVDIHQMNKKFSATVQPKNVCNLELADHLWIKFINQPQSDIVFFAIIKFQIYNILVTKWKHGIGHNDIITFSK